MSATADALGLWCDDCQRPVRKSRDYPDAPLECPHCDRPIRRVSRR